MVNPVSMQRRFLTELFIVTSTLMCITTLSSCQKRALGKEINLEIDSPLSFDIGKPMVMNILLLNKGKTDVRWYEHDGTTELHIQVFGPDGRIARRTELGMISDVMAPFNYSRTLAANQVNNWKVDIGKLYVLSSGSYTIKSSIRVAVPDKPFFVVSSEEKHFIVK